MTYVYVEKYSDSFSDIATPVERSNIYEWILYSTLDRFEKLKPDKGAIIYQGELYLNLFHINRNWTAYMCGRNQPRSSKVIYNLLCKRGESTPLYGYQLGQDDPVEGRAYYQISRRHLGKVAEEIGAYPNLLKVLAKDLDDVPGDRK